MKLTNTADQIDRLSKRAIQTKESQIREASRYCVQFGAINLAQGLPDFPAPEALKQAAVTAILADHNQYADTWGIAPLRHALAQKMLTENGIPIDPETEITICCGATEGLNLALLSVIDPGDRVLIFEPFYENYLPNLVTAGGIPEFFLLHPPTWEITEADLIPLFQKGLKAVILNSPANPTGKVWCYEELEILAKLCQKYNVFVITDEIYEYILFEGKHISMLALPGMKERTIVVNGFSKTFCVTGWRLGYTVAAPPLTAAMRRIHDFLTICAPAPLQMAALAAMQFGKTYFQELAANYRQKRDILLPVLESIGLRPVKPKGAYYIWTDSSVIAENAEIAAYRLAKEANVAVVPGNCFTNPQRSVVQGLRFCFAKRDATLELAAAHLQQWAKGDR